MSKKTTTTSNTIYILLYFLFNVLTLPQTFPAMFKPRQIQEFIQGFSVCSHVQDGEVVEWNSVPLRQIFISNSVCLMLCSPSAKQFKLVMTCVFLHYSRVFIRPKQREYLLTVLTVHQLWTSRQWQRFFLFCSPSSCLWCTWSTVHFSSSSCWISTLQNINTIQWWMVTFAGCCYSQADKQEWR